MVSNFYSDLEKARAAEHLVKDIFTGLTDEYTFSFVGD